MTSISPNSILYSLLQKDTSTSTTSGQAQNPTLAGVLATASGLPQKDSESTSGNSYLLDLSESARAYLQNLSGNGGTSAGSATSANGYGITLNNQQKIVLDTIIAKYKDAPFNDTSFLKMQQDMADAGIGADSLAAQNQMRHLNPTLMLLNALNGGDGSVGTVGGSADIKASTVDFMKKVAQQWASISTTVDDASAEGTSGA